MRLLHLAASCALLAACFSKPTFNGGGTGDGGTDAPFDGPPIDPLGPAQIATGLKHACRLLAGELVCWGSNDHGQQGERTDVPDFNGTPGSVVTQIAGRTGWTSVAAGRTHTCGVRDATAYCWGENFLGQSAPSMTSGNDVGITKVAMPGDIPVERVVTGGAISCALTTTHEAYCWGQINGISPAVAARPTQPLRLGDSLTFTQIALADDHGCALTTTGTVYCWGLAGQQQTGLGTTASVEFGNAARVPIMEAFTSVAVGHEASCGTTETGTLVCWGSSLRGHLGTLLQPNPNTGYEPRSVHEARQWTAVAMGDLHTCAISDGDVYCWGDDLSGALGSGTFEGNRTLAERVETGMKVSQIAAGSGYTCALSSDGVAMKCWGSNSKGELGNHEFSRKYAPTAAKLPAGLPVVQLIAGDNHTCALTGTGPPYTAYCWGLNHRRQIGSSSAAAVQAEPIEAVSPLKFRKLVAGEKHTCGIVDGGLTIECWGENAELQLGTSTQPSAIRGSATAVGGWSDLGAGSRMSCGIDGGSLKCWGARLNGASSQIPTPYTLTGQSWHSIAVGSGFAIGVTLRSSTPYLAGLAATSKRCAAGLVSTDPDNTPAEILSGAAPWNSPPIIAAAQASGAHSCVLRMAGMSLTPTVTCMGQPSLLAIGGTTLTCGSANSTSVNVVFTAGWRAPDASAPSLFVTADHSCALGASNQLLCWGVNTQNELGTITSSRIPTELFPGTQWKAIAGGASHSCGISRTDAKVYCWGENQYGQVGDGTSYEPSPVVSGVP